MTDNNWSTYFTAFLLIIPVLLTGTGATNGRSLCLNTVFDARDNVLVTYQNHTVWLTDMSAGDRPILVGTAYFPEVRLIDAALLINDTTGPCNELGAPCLSLYLIDGVYLWTYNWYHNWHIEPRERLPFDMKPVLDSGRRPYHMALMDQKVCPSLPDMDQIIGESYESVILAEPPVPALLDPMGWQITEEPDVGIGVRALGTEPPHDVTTIIINTTTPFVTTITTSPTELTTTTGTRFIDLVTEVVDTTTPIVSTITIRADELTPNGTGALEPELMTTTTTVDTTVPIVSTITIRADGLTPNGTGVSESVATTTADTTAPTVPTIITNPHELSPNNMMSNGHGTTHVDTTTPFGSTITPNETPISTGTTEQVTTPMADTTVPLVSTITTILSVSTTIGAEHTEPEPVTTTTTDTTVPFISTNATKANGLTPNSTGLPEPETTTRADTTTHTVPTITTKAQEMSTGTTGHLTDIKTPIVSTITTTTDRITTTNDTGDTVGTPNSTISYELPTTAKLEGVGRSGNGASVMPYVAYAVMVIGGAILVALFIHNRHKGYYVLPDN